MGPTWRLLDATCAILGSIERLLGPTWRLLHPTWRLLNSIWRLWGPTWRLLGPIGRLLSPTWSLLHTSWAQLGASCAQHVASWAQLDFYWAQLGAFCAQLGTSWTHFSAFGTPLVDSWVSCASFGVLGRHLDSMWTFLNTVDVLQQRLLLPSQRHCSNSCPCGQNSFSISFVLPEGLPSAATLHLYSPRAAKCNSSQ